jgi:hypothetical protein
MFLRNLVCNFITISGNLKINGVSIHQNIQKDFRNIYDFMEQAVLKNGVEPTNIVFQITPLVLRITIKCHFNLKYAQVSF